MTKTTKALCWALGTLFGIWVLGFIGQAVGIVPRPSAPISSPAKAEITKLAQPDPAAIKEALRSRWSYHESSDEMRGTKTKIASIRSDNATEMEFPYKGSVKLNVVLYKEQNGERSIALYFDKGQMRCYGNTCHVSVKFDGGSVTLISGEHMSDYTGMFVSNSRDTAKLWKLLGTSKQLTIEASSGHPVAITQFAFELPTEPLTL